MPNLVVEMAEDAPLTEGATTTPVAVNAVSNSANPAARMPVVLIMANPPDGSGTYGRVPGLASDTVEQVLV